MPGNTGAITATDQPTGVEVATIQVPAEDTVAKHIQRVAEDWRMNAPAERYRICLVLTPANATAGTNLMGLRKLNANPDVYIIRREAATFAAAALTASPILLWKRATAVAGGTQVAAADIPELDTGAGTASLEVRTGAVTGTKGAQAIDGHISQATLTAGSSSNTRDPSRPLDLAGRIRLTGDEGLILEQNTAGDTDLRVMVLIEWEEQA